MSPADSLQSILDALEAACKERGYERGSFMVNPVFYGASYVFWPEINRISQSAIHADTVDEMLAAVKELPDPVDALVREILKAEARLQELKAQRDGDA